jgi:hypothetical protein
MEAEEQQPCRGRRCRPRSVLDAILGGTQLLLPVVEAGEDGFTATFRIAMRPGEPDAADTFRPGPGRGRAAGPARRL